MNQLKAGLGGRTRLRARAGGDSVRLRQSEKEACGLAWSALWTQLVVSWGSLVGRRGYTDCAGDKTRLPMVPRCLPAPSIHRGGGSNSKDLGTGEGRPSEEAEGEAEENRDTPSLPALLIGHIRLSSICVEGLGVAAVLFHQCRAGMWKPDPPG